MIKLHYSCALQMPMRIKSHGHSFCTLMYTECRFSLFFFAESSTRMTELTSPISHLLYITGSSSVVAFITGAHP